LTLTRPGIHDAGATRLMSSLAGDRPRCVAAVGNRVEGLLERMSTGGP
jgi:hypothetical protein